MFQFSRVAIFFDNLANPILVKEVRQAVKGKFLIVILGMILAMQLILWWTITLPNAYTNITGMHAYVWMLSLFGGALGVAMPVYAGWRILAERAKQDLLFVSALSPFQIIWGKFLSSASIILIVFSTFLPFFYLTLLLGGIDLLSITYSLGIVVIALLLSVIFTIFMLCGIVPITLKVILILATLYGLGCLATLTGFSTSILFNDYMLPTSEERLYSFLSWMIGGPIVIGLFIVLSTCIISPCSSNRAVVPRIYSTASLFARGFLSLV